jgi:hypothetical protein
MVVVVPQAAVASTIATAGGHGIPALVVGEVIETVEGSAARYVEGPLEGIA